MKFLSLILLTIAPLIGAEWVSPNIPLGLEFNESRTPLVGDKLITDSKQGAKIHLTNGAIVEVGRNSIVLFDSLNTEENLFSVVLVKGKLRAKMNNGELSVKCPSASISIKSSIADVILANLNILAIAREGAGIIVKNSAKETYIPLMKYALVTTEGKVVITDPTSSKKTNEEDDDE